MGASAMHLYSITQFAYSRKSAGAEGFRDIPAPHTFGAAMRSQKVGNAELPGD
jgi:hypothetical protein